MFKVTTGRAIVDREARLFCQLTIPQNGDAIVSRAGNVELQIDAAAAPSGGRSHADANTDLPAAMRKCNEPAQSTGATTRAKR